MAFDIHWPILATEVILIITAVTGLLLDLFFANHEKRGSILSGVGMAGTGLAFLNLVGFQYFNYGYSFGGSFSQDGLSVFFKSLFLLAGFFTLFMVSGYQKKLKRGHGEFSLLILFSLIGICFLASAHDFLLFFVALETLTVSLYAMTAYLRDKTSSIEAGVKYIIIGALSTAVFLYGLSFIYGAVGSTAYSEIQRKLVLFDTLPPAFIFGMILIVASLCFKISAVPFHLWAPDVYEGAPTPVTAYLATASKAAGFAALLKLMLTVFMPAWDKLTILFAALSALTILYGNLAAIPQTNIKRLLAYSSIGHAGYLLMGLASLTHSGKEALCFYLLSYVFSTAGAFLVIVAVSNHVKSDEISEYNGLAKKSPLLAAGMLLALFSLAGVPPLAGFFAKFYILWAGMQAGFFWLAVLGILNVIVSLYYYLKIVKAIYINPPSGDLILTVSPTQKAMQYAAIIAILLLGLAPGPFLSALLAF